MSGLSIESESREKEQGKVQKQLFIITVEAEVTAASLLAHLIFFCRPLISAAWFNTRLLFNGSLGLMINLI